MKRTSLAKAVQVLFLVAATAVVLLPFLIILVVSMRTRDGFMSNPIALPDSLYLDNYFYVIEKSKMLYGFYNSAFILIITTGAVVICALLAAYALTKMNFEKAGIFSRIFLAPMIFPIYSSIIPLYLFFSKLHLVNKYGVIIIETAVLLPMAIFILTSFMKTVPYQISESAIIDGASHFRILYQIIVPLIRPAFATTIILTALPVWNDFFVPLIMINDIKQRTLPLIIVDFSGISNQDHTKISAICMCMVIPVITIYIFLQKEFIKGITDGAIKS